jgi:hypothetical protein
MSRTAWLLSRGYAIRGGAVSALKTWTSGEVLQASDLVAEFAHGYNAGIGWVSPATGDMDWNSKDQTNCDEIHFADAADNPTAAGRLRRNGAILVWRGTTGQLFQLRATGTDSQAILGLQNDAQLWLVYTDTNDGFVIRDSTGGTTRVGITTGGVLTITGQLSIGGNNAIVPAAVSGTPAQHGLFRENVPKGWLTCNFGGTISDSFNVSSITDAGTGLVTVTWDRDFANTAYAVLATVEATPNVSGGVGFIATVVPTSRAVGSAQIQVVDQAGTAQDGTLLSVLAIGDQ